MCFAPQRRALFRHLNLQKWSESLVSLTFWLRNVLCATTACTFRHLNFQKWSEPLVFLTFWLRNLLRATTACTFSTSQLPKVVWGWGVLYILTSKCASRHNGVHFSSLIWPAGSAPAALASLLFDPPEPQIIGKTQCFATFLPFHASASSFFWLFLFSDLLSSNLSLLSASALLCFSSVHIVGSLTSKLPSNNTLIHTNTTIIISVTPSVITVGFPKCSLLGGPVHVPRRSRCPHPPRQESSSSWQSSWQYWDHVGYLRQMNSEEFRRGNAGHTRIP